MHVELKHTVTVDHRAFWLRFYLWLYEADVKEVTFCKLFWAYVFVLPAFLLRFLVIEPLCLVVLAREKRKQKREPKVTMRVEVEHRTGEPPAKEPSVMSRWLIRMEDAANRCVLAAKATGHVIGMNGRLGYWFRRLVLVVGGLLGIGLVALVVYLLFTVEWVQFTGLGVATFAIFLLFAALVNLADRVERFGLWVLPGAQFTGRGVKRGALGFFEMLKLGYVAVKSSTCPRIEVK